MAQAAERIVTKIVNEDEQSIRLVRLGGGQGRAAEGGKETAAIEHDS